MKIKDIVKGGKVWTMIGNYPYEVVVLSFRDNSHLEPRGTFQKDSVTVWRQDKGTTHKRKTWEIFDSKESIKQYLFPS